MTESALDLSAVKKKIPKVAFELFRFWTKEAGIAQTLTIKTEQQLVQDLEDTLKNGINALREKDLDQKPLGWDIGFIIGFLDGNLGEHWHHEYVAQNSEVYKSFLGLRAIENYLRFDELIKIRIDTLYEHLSKEDSNIDNLQLTVTKTDLSIDGLTLQPTSEEGKVMAILHNLIGQQIKLVAAMKNTVELPIEKYFLTAEIERLIADNLGEK